MRQLSSSGRQAVDELARRHGFSLEAVQRMLEAVVDGNGRMAQFEHPDFSGSGQWMQGGMTMVSNLSDHGLKNRIDRLCNDLSNLLSEHPEWIRSDSFQSQTQGRPTDSGDARPSAEGGLFTPKPSASGADWPSALGQPDSAGSQNGMRYAYFSKARRLAVETEGRVTVYDTLDHQIGGVSQQQSSGRSLTFTSQHGPVDLASLKVVSAGTGSPPAARAEPAEAAASPAGGDPLAILERLADLHAKGVLSEDEFARKKAELLERL